MTQKISPFFWFDSQAEEAAKFYCSIFKGKITHVSPGPGGKPMSVGFTIRGLEVIALNGGPHYKLNPAASLFVSCKTQRELDTLWKKLGKGGTELQCGWLTDRFGLTWQIIPDRLFELIGGPDRKKAGAATQAMMQMKKIELAKLERAYANG